MDRLRALAENCIEQETPPRSRRRDAVLLLAGIFIGSLAAALLMTF